MPQGKGQSKDYLFINLKAHYLNISVILTRQTIQPLRVDATSTKRRKQHPCTAVIAGEGSRMLEVFSV